MDNILTFLTSPSQGEWPVFVRPCFDGKGSERAWSIQPDAKDQIAYQSSKCIPTIHWSLSNFLNRSVLFNIIATSHMGPWALVCGYYKFRCVLHAKYTTDLEKIVQIEQPSVSRALCWNLSLAVYVLDYWILAPKLFILQVWNGTLNSF